MASDIKTAIVRAVLNTSIGNQTFTATPPVDFTPKLALFIVNGGITDGVAAVHNRGGIGCCDADAQWAFAWRSEDGQDPSDTGRSNSAAQCLKLMTASADTDDVAATFVSFGTSSVTINISNAGAAFLCTVILFGGDDLQVDVGIIALGTQDTEINVTGPGFQPNLVGCCQQRNIPTTTNACKMSLGFAYDAGGSVPQCAHIFTSRDGRVADSEVNSILRNDMVGISLTGAGAADYTVEIDNFDASGFSAFARSDDGTGDSVGYFCLDTGDRSVWAGNFTTPGSTGEDAQTGPGFKPQLVGLITTQLPTVNVIDSSGLAGGFGYSFFTEDDEFCNAWADEDVPGAVTDTQSLADNQVINVPADDGVALFAATFVSMDVNGWTNDYSAVDSGNARLQCGFAIQEAGAAALGMPPSLFKHAQRRSPLLRM